MIKNIFFDLETTGLHHWEHGIHQISAIMDYDGEEVDFIDLKFKPPPHIMVDDGALAISHLTLEDLSGRIGEGEAYRLFIEWLDGHIDRFNKGDKAFLYGYNNAYFDEPFLRAFFERNNNKYWGSYFYQSKHDVFVYVCERFKLFRINNPSQSFSLSEVGVLLGIDIDASMLHDGLYDTRLCREVFYRLKGFSNLKK